MFAQHEQLWLAPDEHLWTEMVLDAPEMAGASRRARPSIGTVADPYDKALAETTRGRGLRAAMKSGRGRVPP